MARTIRFTYDGDGKEYTLGFTLDTVRTMENAGFVLEEIKTKPTVRIPELFYGAFMAKHRGIKRRLVEDIWDGLNRKDDLVVALAELYGEAQSSLVDEGNGDWTITE